jgi:hypothetical protein
MRLLEFCFSLDGTKHSDPLMQSLPLISSWRFPHHTGGTFPLALSRHSGAKPSFQAKMPGLRAGILFLLLFGYPGPAEAAPGLKIVDYQSRLNREFPRKIRKETHFIVLHSTESRLPSALRTLSKGKVSRGRYITHGGHAHYLVARNGVVYRILDPKYWANHAGISLWNGHENLSNSSLGIELEGYHNVPFPEEQYRSLRLLLDDLQERYGIADRDVVEHYRVAYSPPSRYHRHRLRGRKKDPGENNFDRKKAGLEDQYAMDPDVLAGRVKGPLLLAKAPAPEEITDLEEEVSDAETEELSDTAGTEMDLPEEAPSNRIGQGKTAWSIAGSQYNAPTTLYRFPSGVNARGDQIQDWAGIPAGTEVELNVPVIPTRRVVSSTRAEIEVPETGPDVNPWKIANALYRSSMTFYLFPDGTVKAGNQITNFNSIPFKTRILVAYQELLPPKTRDRLGEDLPDVYLNSQTLYLFPNRTIQSGDQLEDFLSLPPGTRVFGKRD